MTTGVTASGTKSNRTLGPAGCFSLILTNAGVFITFFILSPLPMAGLLELGFFVYVSGMIVCLVVDATLFVDCVDYVVLCSGWDTSVFFLHAWLVYVGFCGPTGRCGGRLVFRLRGFRITTK